eukprot:2208417-Pleurochrysis_carterae.AAC.1
MRARAGRGAHGGEVVDGRVDTACDEDAQLAQRRQQPHLSAIGHCSEGERRSGVRGARERESKGRGRADTVAGGDERGERGRGSVRRVGACRCVPVRAAASRCVPLRAGACGCAPLDQ